MQTREETQQTVRYLLDKIITFNKSKSRDYLDMCYDIQRDYGKDDYVDMLSYMENCGRSLSDNDEAINELSDTDLATAENHLRGTAEFLGLDTHDIQNGTGYSIIQTGDFSIFDYFDFPTNPLELLQLFFPHRPGQPRRISPPGGGGRFISRNAFKQQSASEQLEFLRSIYNEFGRREGGQEKADYAKLLRSWRAEMKLSSLLALGRPFMNGPLRNFLNTNTNGSDRYEWEEVHKEPWREVVSLGSKMHQRTAPDTRVLIRVLYMYSTHIKGWVQIPIYAYNRLNAKFCHPDGREAVFSYVSKDRGEFVDQIFDKGTYNYGDDRGSDIIMGLSSIPLLPHDSYDIKPFNEWFDDLEKQENYAEEIRRLSSENGIDKCNLLPPFGGNSQFWRYN